jgi:hypothetical protein
MVRLGLPPPRLHFLFLRRDGELGCGLDSGGDLGQDAFAFIHGTNDFSQRGESACEEQRPDDAADAAEQQRVRCADPARQTPRQQAAKRRHPHECHRIDAHHAPALIVVNNRLQNGVAGCHLHHEAEPCHDHQRQGEGENARLGKGNKPDTEDGRGARNNLLQADRRFSLGEIDGAAERADAGRCHQKAKRVRATVQDFFCKNRHENRIRHSHNADQCQEKQDSLDRSEAKGVGETFAQAVEDVGVFLVAAARRHSHSQQRDDHGDIADGVN